jgi:hypothetical protein
MNYRQHFESAVEAIRRVICPTGKSATACASILSSPDRKNISVFPNPNQFYNSRRLVPTRGALRGRHGMMLLRTAKTCGPDAPTLASSLAELSAQATVARKPGHRGEHEISR